MSNTLSQTGTGQQLTNTAHLREKSSTNTQPRRDAGYVLVLRYY